MSYIYISVVFGVIIISGFREDINIEVCEGEKLDDTLLIMGTYRAENRTPDIHGFYWLLLLLWTSFNYWSVGLSRFL